MSENKVGIFAIGALSIFGTRDNQMITGIRIKAGICEQLFVDYYKAKTLKELQTVEVSQNSDIFTQWLTVREDVTFRSVGAEFEAAKEMAGDQLICMVFDEFRSKK